MAEHIDFSDQILSNKWKSFFLMMIVAIVIVLLGVVIAQVFAPMYTFTVLIVAILFSIFYLWLSYYYSDKIAIVSVNAKSATREKFREYYNLVEGLTIASGLPMPRLYIMQNDQINAFASGRNPKNAVICVTTGALEKLEKRELEGVLAHELGHVGNYDIRYMTLVSVMVGMIAIISEIFLRSLWFKSGGDNEKSNAIFLIIGIILAVLAPIVVGLVQLSISRKREFMADATSVKFTRNPQGLIKALEKIRDDYKAGVDSKRRVGKSVAPLFFASPFKDALSTHPSIEKRISVLKSI